jgi:hypothetical protein
MPFCDHVMPVGVHTGHQGAINALAQCFLSMLRGRHE